MVRSKERVSQQEAEPSYKYFHLLFSLEVAFLLSLLFQSSLLSVSIHSQSCSAKRVFLPSPSSPSLSDGFESGWNQTKWPIYAPDCNQGGVVSLDSTTAHTGKNSMKVAGAGGYCGHIFFGTTAIPTGDVYVRAYV